MKKRARKDLWISLGLLGAFLLWTLALRFVDVQNIGPLGSSVGFAVWNRFVHRLTGVHLSLYIVTDWLSLIPLGFAAGFGFLGLVQWIRRKHLRKVERSILGLGIFYGVVMGVFVFFELFPVNYRPVLLEGSLEASYPSSTTMLVVCVMLTTGMQLDTRIQKASVRRLIRWAIGAFTLFMVIVRLLSGVHWITDIVGGILVSGGLVKMYSFACGFGTDRDLSEEAAG